GPRRESRGVGKRGPVPIAKSCELEARRLRIRSVLPNNAAKLGSRLGGDSGRLIGPERIGVRIEVGFTRSARPPRRRPAVTGKGTTARAAPEAPSGLSRTSVVP